MSTRTLETLVLKAVLKIITKFKTVSKIQCVNLKDKNYKLEKHFVISKGV